MSNTEDYDGGEEEDVEGEEEIIEIDEAELRVMVKESFNKLQNVPTELRAPLGKFRLVEIDRLQKPSETNSSVAYSTIGIFDTYEEAKRAAKARVQVKDVSYKIYDSEGKCVSGII